MYASNGVTFLLINTDNHLRTGNAQESLPRPSLLVNGASFRAALQSLTEVGDAERGPLLLQSSLGMY